jgi:hypothetical protein
MSRLTEIGAGQKVALFFIRVGVCEVGSFHDADPHAEAAVEDR